MKHFFLITILFISSGVYGQNDFLVTNSRDTIYGKVTFPTPKGTEKVMLKNDDGNQEFTVGKIFSAMVKGTEYRKIWVVDKFKIAKVEISGFLSMLKFRNEGEYEFSTYYLIKQSGESLQVSALVFRRKMAQFLGDCNELADAINKKEYNFRQINQVVERYNADCTNIDVSEVKADVGEEFGDLAELQAALEEVLTKLGQNEEIPGYLRNVLVKYSDKDVNALIDKLLKKIEDQ